MIILNYTIFPAKSKQKRGRACGTPNINILSTAAGGFLPDAGCG